MSESRTWTDGRAGFRRQWARLAGVGFLLAGMSPLAQAGAGHTRPYRLPPDLLQYFKARYFHVDDTLSEFRLKETPEGPLGSFQLIGAIRPTVSKSGGTPEERAQSMALAFIEQEAALFDIPDLAEIRAAPFRAKDDGSALISFSRHISGFRLLQVSISIQVRADGAISRVDATLTPASSDVYWAVKRETIPVEEVMTIVRGDLARSDRKAELTIEEPGKYATWRPPYVIWGVRGARRGKPFWTYSIDAFTGKILDKICATHRDFPPYGPLCE